MTKAQKVAFVINTLEELYPEIPIPLDHKDPYTLLIAVLVICPKYRCESQSDHSSPICQSRQSLGYGQVNG